MELSAQDKEIIRLKNLLNEKEEDIVNQIQKLLKAKKLEKSVKVEDIPQDPVTGKYLRVISQK